MFKFKSMTYIFFIGCLLFLKFLFYFLVKESILSISFGGGNDADYYHGYAIGDFDVAVNSWPIILAWLNSYNMYSRDVISYILLFLSIVVIPYFFIKNAGLNFYREQRIYLLLIILALVYPTLYFYTFDIYRDVFMVFSFLIGCFLVKKWIKSRSLTLFLLMFPVLVIFGCFLISLRPYLGYAFLVSLFLWNIKFTKKRIFIFLIIYLLILFLANYIGLLNRLVEYRSGFLEGNGGSTLGLDFSNPVMFLPNFVLSTLGQLFGLYITNPVAVLLLLIETVPFTYMLYYVFKHISYADKFVQFLLVFFVVYASVWLIGNDNLGTAVRLRMYNYIAVYICFFVVLAKVQNHSVKELTK